LYIDKAPSGFTPINSEYGSTQVNKEAKLMNRNTELLDAVDLYFRALYQCDLEMFDRVFHPASSLFDVDEGQIDAVPIAGYRDLISKRKSPASVGQAREDEIIMIDWLSDRCATVKVRLRIHQNIFIDHLCFSQGEDGFRIVAKVWHLERVLAS
jgi:Putative lumazine-binding